MAEHSKATSKLCETCQSLGIANYFLPPVEGETHTRSNIGELLYKSKELGTRKEIRNRSERCAFCTLILVATSSGGGNPTITINSVFCGRNKTPTGTDLDPAYDLTVFAQFPTGRMTSRIQLVADDAEKLGISRDYRAREPEVGGFDMRQAREWLDLCCSKHGDSCTTLDRGLEGALPVPQPQELLAIDLVKMCICNMPTGSPYAALSYCWPSKAYLTLIKKNKVELFEHGTLADRMGDLPGTVQDAIECAKDLPYRYLWIDALCIVQDDADHKLGQLHQMDLVYSCAQLTLVCAYPVDRSTGDPCSGFPGYKKAEQSRARAIHQVDSIRLMVASPDVEEYLLSTRWNTRCWTFQEGLLSRRLLYFTPVQVYFQCSQGLFCEDTDCENIDSNAHVQPGSTLWNPKARNLAASSEGNDWGVWTLNRKPLDGLEAMMQSYEKALSYYTYRDVSFSSDILNAFEGIRVVLSEAMRTDFWQGIPEKLLPQALCWQLRGPYKRRLGKPDGTMPPKRLFPSWTWAGWDSSVNLNVHLAIQKYRTDAEFYIINRDGFATRLDVEPQMMTLSRQRPSASILKAFLPNIVPREEVDASSDIWRTAQALGIWTTSASFFLDGSQHKLHAGRHESQWPESTNFAIKDPWGSTAGCILLPKDYFQHAPEEGMVCEFVLLSRGLKLESEFQDTLGLTYFDESVYMTRGWCHLNVMMILRKGGVEAQRIGVGVMSKEAWGAAAPEATFVKLV